MSRWNPFMLDYSQNENRVTALLLHVLEETNLTNQFLLNVLVERSLHNLSFELSSQLHRDITDNIKEAFIFGISRSGIIIPSKSGQSLVGDPDGVFFSKQNDLVILLETKIAKGELIDNQLERHKKRINSLNSSSIPVKSVSWKKVLDFFGDASVSLNDKDNYIIKHFLEFIKQECLGYRDIETIYYKGSRFGEVPRCLHQLMLSKGFNFKFNTGTPDTVEYRHPISKNSAALDVINGRFIFKFSRRAERFKAKMLQLIKDKVGENYSGTYENVSGEANLPLRAITCNDIDIVEEILEKSLEFRIAAKNC